MPMRFQEEALVTTATAHLSKSCMAKDISKCHPDAHHKVTAHPETAHQTKAHKFSTTMPPLQMDPHVEAWLPTVSLDYNLAWELEHRQLDLLELQINKPVRTVARRTTK